MLTVSIKETARLESSEQHSLIPWKLAGLAGSTLLSSLATSIVNVALPELADVFGASFQRVQWLVLVYLLTITALIVSVGRLGDLMGRRRLLLIGIVLFAIASTICGLSPSLNLLLTGRALQGLGAAIMMSLSMALIGESMPKTMTGSAMGFLGSMSAIGTALGPALGGILISAFGWRSIFLIKLPLAIATLLIVVRHIPQDRKGARMDRSQMDICGTVILALTLGMFALATTLGRGSFGALNFTFLSSSLCGVMLFVLVEAEVKFPLLPLAIFRNSGLRASLLMSAIVSTVMMSTLVVGPFYLSRTLGLSSASIGNVMAIGPVVAVLTGAPAGFLVDRFGSAKISLYGLTGIAAGFSMLATLPTTLGPVGYIFAIAISTAGYAVFQAANNTAVLKNVEPERRGVFSGILNLSRNLGLITGASFMGAVFAFASGTANPAAAASEAVASGLRTTSAAAAALIVVAMLISIRNRFALISAVVILATSAVSNALAKEQTPDVTPLPFPKTQNQWPLEMRAEAFTPGQPGSDKCGCAGTEVGNGRFFRR